jgi:hypothetical protein
VEFLAVVAVGGAALLVVARRLARGQVRTCVEAAQQAGLQDVRTKGRGLWGRAVHARHGPHAVRIVTLFNQAAGGTVTRVEVDGVTTRLSLRSVFTAPFAVAQASEVRLGDDSFDAAISVRGSERIAAALLDHRTRDRIREIFAARASLSNEASDVGGGRVEGGRLVAEQVVGDQPIWIASFLRELLALAEALRDPTDVESRLIANLRGDPDPQVRRTSLRLLLDDRPPGTALQAVLRAAAEDPHETVALEAALALGSEGRPTVMRIATEGWASDVCAARAVRELRGHLAAEQVRSVLSDALRRRRLATARACVESLSYRGRAQVDVLTRVLAIEDGPLAAAAARGLGRLGQAEDVAALQDAAARLAGDAEIERAVRDAVAAIRSRLVGAGEGQVSLADAEPGRVSLTGDEAGRVALAGDEDRG